MGTEPPTIERGRYSRPRSPFPRTLVVLAVVLGAIAGAAFVVPATPAAAQTPDRENGPYPTPHPTTGYIEASCLASFSGPTAWTPADPPMIGSGSVVLVRCYGPPTLTSDPGIVGFGASYYRPGNSSLASIGGCLPNGEMEPELGRFSWSCTPSHSPIEVDVAQGIHVGWYEPETGGASTLSPGGNTPTTPGDPRAQIVFTGEQWSSAGWPTSWPETATPIPPPETEGTIPRVVCRRSLSEDFEGRVLADFRAEVTNPHPDGEDAVGYWQFEWEGPPGPPPGGYSTTTEWWDATPTHAGRVLRDVEVPTADVPDRGWIVRYVMVRTLTDVVSTEFPDPSVYSEQIEIPSGGGSNWNVGIGPVGVGGDVPDYGVDSTTYGYSFGGTTEGGIFYWSEVQGRCSQMVKPWRANQPDGSGGTVLNPGSDGGPGFEVVGPGPDDPDDPAEVPEGGCDTPDSWWNVAGWVGWAGCNVLDGLASILAGLVDAIGDILSWLDGLADWLLEQLIPTESISDMIQRLQDDWSDTAIGEMIGAVGTFVSDLGDSFSGFSSSGSCEGPPITFTAQGTDKTVHPVDTCGDRAWIATLFRTSVGALFILAAVYRIVTMVGKPFGIGAPDGEGDK